MFHASALTPMAFTLHLDLLGIILISLPGTTFATSEKCPANITNGVLSSSCNRSVGESCSYSCDEGYSKHLMYLTCTEERKWSLQKEDICYIEMPKDPPVTIKDGVSTAIQYLMCGIGGVFFTVILVAIIMKRSRRRVPGRRPCDTPSVYYIPGDNDQQTASYFHTDLPDFYSEMPPAYTPREESSNSFIHDAAITQADDMPPAYEPCVISGNALVPSYEPVPSYEQVQVPPYEPVLSCESVPSNEPIHSNEPVPPNNNETVPSNGEAISCEVVTDLYQENPSIDG